MPITEFRCFGKPILAADLPYAHESAAGCEHVRFFDPDDTNALADSMMHAADADPIFHAAPQAAVQAPFAKNWLELWKILLG